MLARGRALSACAAVALAVAGCTTAASTTSVAGSTLSIYLSLPPGTPTPEQQDVISAEKLAFQQNAPDGKVGGFTVRLVPFHGLKLSDNARQAIGDSTTIAYLGELQPGASEDTIGITNAEDVLQVSPTDTAVEETQHSAAIPNSPNRYYESLSTYNRTFARVSPTDAQEASMLLVEMRTLGVRRLYVMSDGTPYGVALAHAMNVGGANPSGTTVASSVSGADAVMYAGGSPAAAAAALNQAVARNPAVKLFAPSALAESSFAAALSPAAQRATYVSSPGDGPGNPLPASGQQFVSTFKSTYGHAPAQQAIFGYEAMAALVSVLHEAGSAAGNRSAVVKDFFGIRNRNSVLGTYSIDKNGDTTMTSIVISRVKAGKLVPLRALG